MKLMQAIGGKGHGGAETFFVSLALAFKRAGIDQKITMRANRVRHDELCAGGLEPEICGFGGKFDFMTPRRLQRSADEFKPDIYMSWMSRAAMMTPKGNFPKLARLGGYYKLKYYQKCDHLIGNTEGIRDYLVQAGWPAARAHYVPNFVTWNPAPAIDRSTFNTPDGVPLLLALGRLHPNKAFDVAIKSMVELKDAWLWIAGDGMLKAELEKLAEDLGVADRVRFLGWRRDREALFAAADICVYPSRIEPFGNVTLDAWAAKVPIVAAASAGPRAYIRHEQDGLLVEIENHRELAAGVARLLSDPGLAKNLCDNGYRRFEAEFNEAAVVARWQTLFAAL